MRIRKNAKLSSILPSHASTSETLQTHVCQLNQSPWDVIPFSQDSCPSLNYQLEGEDSFTGNGSFGDSMGAIESVASMMDGEEKEVIFKVDELIIDDNETGMDRVENVFVDGNEEIKMEDEFGLDNDHKTPCCVKTCGKGWHCRNESKNGHALCDHHQLSLLKKPDKAMAALSRRGGRARATAKKGSSSSSNPYEFYYYSGFGPSWGKRRGDRVIEEKKKCKAKDLTDQNSSRNNDKTPSSSSQIDNNEFDFVDDEDDEEDDENGDSGRKRIRKPVKARSLKSLM